MHPLLELADGPHRPVDVQQVLWRQSLPLNRVGHVAPPWVWWIEASRPRRALAPRTPRTATHRGPAPRNRTARAPPGPHGRLRPPAPRPAPAPAAARSAHA